MQMKHVLNAAEMKQQNEKKVLDQIRIRPIPRIEIARNIGLTRAAVSVLANQLIDQGILMEGQAVSGKKGRHSVELMLNPDTYFMVGVDLARDDCTLGIVDFAGRIREIRKLRFDGSKKDAGEALEKLSGCLAALLEAHTCPGRLLGIGITAPGPLDVRQGVILNPPNFPLWHHCAIADALARRFSCFTVLENNAKALALAEKYYGIGARFSDYISLVVDTGIGGGIMLDGRLYEGAHGFGSDFGHISLDMNGKRCSCGNRGCAELYGAMPNILAQARKLDAGLSSWRQVVDGAEAGQENALKILELEAGYLAALITNIANIFDIETVILAGDIAYHGELITRRIEEIVNGQFIGRQVSRVSVYPSKMPEHANVLACANLVMEAFSRKQIPLE